LFKIKTLAWHEIKKTFKMPSFYFMAALFLFYQGIVFSLNISLRHHMLSPPGPLLAPYFGGPFWFWPLMILVVVELSHGSISMEKSKGTLENLLASPLSPFQIAWGKFIAIFCLYSILWLLTLPLILLLWLYLPPGTTLEIAPIITGYLGASLIGGAGLGLGLFFSSLTKDTRLAGMLTFVTLFILVLLKILVNPSFGIISTIWVIKISKFINFFDYMESFAKGIIVARDITILLGIIILTVISTGFILGKDQKIRKSSTILSLFLIFIIIIQIVTLFSWGKNQKNYVREYEIDPVLISKLEKINTPVKIYIFSIPPSSTLFMHPLYQMENSLNKIEQNFNYIEVEKIFVSKISYRTKKLAKKFKIDLKKIQQDASTFLEGVIVVEMGDKYRKISVVDTLVIDYVNNKLKFNGIRLESELASTLAYLQDPKSSMICITGGHGELSTENSGTTGLSKLIIGLRTQGWVIKYFNTSIVSIPQKCRTLFIPGPLNSLLQSEVQAIENYLELGGNIVLLINEQKGINPSFEPLLKKWGIQVGDYQINDPKNLLFKTGGYKWITTPGDDFKKKNWRIILERPRELILNKTKGFLFSSSQGKRILSNSKTIISNLKGDTKKIPVAAKTTLNNRNRNKIVVFGFITPFTNGNLKINGRSDDSSTDLLWSLFEWTGNRIQKVKIPPKPITHHHLSLKISTISSLNLFSIFIWPLFILTIGLWVWFKRRK
jgi:gliding motility-associated transport system permease protein